MVGSLDDSANINSRIDILGFESLSILYHSTDHVCTVLIQPRVSFRRELSGKYHNGRSATLFRLRLLLNVVQRLEESCKE